MEEEEEEAEEKSEEVPVKEPVEESERTARARRRMKKDEEEDTHPVAKASALRGIVYVSMTLMCLKPGLDVQATPKYLIRYVGTAFKRNGGMNEVVS